MAFTRSALLQFHGSHFPGQPSPPLSHPTLGLSSTDAPHELEHNVQDDDLLGYYDDGVKRTLSDEQVAIFRHTEIQELLREKREKSGAPSGSPAGSESTGERYQANSPSQGNRDQSSTPLNQQKKGKHEV